MAHILKLSIIYKGTTIGFDLEYRDRRTFSIQIEPPDKILVVSPLGLSEESVKERVQEKGSWIVKKLQGFSEIGYSAQGRRFINGGTFLYLGKEYQLKIIKNMRKIPKVFFANNKFYLEARDPGQEMMRKAMEKWYRKEAAGFIEGRIDYFSQKVGRCPNTIRAKQQKRRWGSCTSKGDIYINWRIIMAPPDIIDYLLVHELCHLVHSNHSVRYWQKVGSVMGDYKERRKWLKKYGILLDI